MSVEEGLLTLEGVSIGVTLGVLEPDQVGDELRERIGE